MAKQFVPVTEAWFSQPQGRDYPGGGFVKALHKRPCRVTFLGAEPQSYFDCHASFEADSQSPRIVLTIGANIKQSGAPRPQLLFNLQDNDVGFGIEKPGNNAFEKITEFRSSHPEWFQGMGKVYFTEITPRRDAVRVGQPWLFDSDTKAKWDSLCRAVSQAWTIFIWQEWQDKFQSVQQAHSWLLLLQRFIQAIARSDDHRAQSPVPTFDPLYDVSDEEEGEILPGRASTVSASATSGLPEHRAASPDDTYMEVLEEHASPLASVETSQVPRAVRRRRSPTPDASRSFRHEAKRARTFDSLNAGLDEELRNTQKAQIRSLVEAREDWNKFYLRTREGTRDALDRLDRCDAAIRQGDRSAAATTRKNLTEQRYRMQNDLYTSLQVESDVLKRLQDSVQDALRLADDMSGALIKAHDGEE